MDEDPIRETMSGREAYSLFCLSLGELHHGYTAVEAELNLAIYVVVTRLSKRRNTSIIMAVLGGQRMAPAKDTIKRLLRATNASQRKVAYIEAVFAQLGEIQFFRDRLTHHFTHGTDDPAVWVNVNFAGVKEPHLMEDITFELAALRSASADLQYIRQNAANFFNHYYKLPDESGGTPELPTWQYKPSMLTRDRPIKVRSGVKQTRPRKSQPPKLKAKKDRK